MEMILNQSGPIGYSDTSPKKINITESDDIDGNVKDSLHEKTLRTEATGLTLPTRKRGSHQESSGQLPSWVQTSKSGKLKSAPGGQTRLASGSQSIRHKNMNKILKSGHSSLSNQGLFH
jgi:hypothetical protein